MVHFLWPWRIRFFFFKCQHCLLYIALKLKHTRYTDTITVHDASRFSFTSLVLKFKLNAQWSAVLGIGRTVISWSSQTQPWINPGANPMKDWVGNSLSCSLSMCLCVKHFQTFEYNKPAVQAACADPSKCVSIYRQNPPIHQNCLNF